MKNTTLAAGLMAIITLFAAGNAAAAPLEKGDWLLRLGITHVDPNDDSDVVVVAGDAVMPSGVDVGSDTSLGITLEYMLTNNFGLELLAAWPFEHDIDGNGALSGVDIGSTKHLPPTLSINYHFMPTNNIRPYIGAGINYTTFFSEDTSSAIKAMGYKDLELDDSWGWAAQIGVDADINDRWFINASVRYIDIDTDATIKGFGNNAGLKITVDNVEIDPWIYSLMIGTSF